MAHAAAIPSFRIVSMGSRPRQAAKTTQSQSRIGFGGDRKEPLWQCVEGCGACCKLNKGPSFATPEEIFDDPSDIQLYKSMIGPDGWCIHYEKGTRKCSIYSERPYFCRVEPDVFQTLYGVPKKKFNKKACSSCRDTIKAIYGSDSKELDNFNRSITS
ncbi:zinc/iron-chelating domain protein [Parasponia andersonii]|uniref:Zinc/iron-chelating domain protein n=1 Tax=Parasponia andersonii TaxID=3476 RepID=A0A2P5DHL9_PARAD|nr:zinc/iron-chelating domain protein [Parasponia andersonii]